MTAEITIKNLNPGRKIDRSEVRRVAARAMGKVCSRKCEVNIVFVADRQIQKLNKKYLGKDRATDVLAFQGEGFADDFSGGANNRETCFLGDIAISSDMAVRNADIYGTSFKEEIARYVAHGVLHLGGYDDTTARDKETMRKKEDEILQESRKKIRK